MSNGAWFVELDHDPEWQQRLSSDPKEQSNEDWMADYNHTLEEEQSMPIIAKDTGGRDFEIPEQGTHIALCTQVIHLGIQPSKNPAYKPKDTIYIRWELPNERMKWEKDGKQMEGPMVVSNFYTNSLSPKSYLRKDLEGWRAKSFTEEELQGFDVTNILGKACMLTIIHNDSGGKTYANVATVSALPKGTPAPKPEGDLVVYTADEPEAYENLPEFLQKKIDTQIREEDIHDAGSQASEEFDDDIPF